MQTLLQGGPNQNTIAVNLQNLGNRSEYYYEISTADKDMNN